MKKRIICFITAFIAVFALTACAGKRSGGGFSPDGKLQVHFIDAGNADSIYILLPDGRDMIIDGGTDEAKAHIIKYLNKINAGKLDYCVATHPHSDHIGGLDDVINEFGAEEIFLTKARSNTKSFERLLEAADKSGAAITEAKSGEVIFEGDGISAYILSPTEKRDLKEDLNDSSAVIRLVYGDTAFLFMGDAGKSVEKELINSGENLQADVIKLGHHGSSTASGKAFIKRVNPEYAVITCGKGNSYGHPHRETVSLMAKSRINVYRSDEKGDIVFSSDGKSLSVKTEK